MSQLRTRASTPVANDLGTKSVSVLDEVTPPSVSRTRLGWRRVPAMASVEAVTDPMTIAHDASNRTKEERGDLGGIVINQAMKRRVLGGDFNQSFFEPFDILFRK